MNTVPGLSRRGGRTRGVCGPVLGISLEIEKRHARLGCRLGWISLTLAVLFFLGGIFRSGMTPEVLNLEDVRTGFGILGVVSAMGVHLLLFVAEGLRGRDAPKAVWALVLFWIGFVVFGLW